MTASPRFSQAQLEGMLTALRGLDVEPTAVEDEPNFEMAPGSLGASLELCDGREPIPYGPRRRLVSVGLGIEDLVSQDDEGGDLVLRLCGRVQSLRGLVALAEAAPVRKVRFEQCEMSDRAWDELALLADLPQLETIVFGTHLPPRIAGLGAIASLRSVEFDDLRPGAVLPELEPAPGVTACRVSLFEGGLAPLASLPGLRRLELHPDLGLDDLGPIGSLRSLEHLELVRVGGNNHDFSYRFEDLSPLASCTQLRVLRLPDCRLARDLGPLEGLTELRELDLIGNLCIEDPRPLLSLRKLQTLRLGRAVTGERLAALFELPELVELRGGISDECEVLELGGSSMLETLELGVHGVQQLTLGPCPSLKRLKTVASSVERLTLRDLPSLETVELGRSAQLRVVDIIGAQPTFARVDARGCPHLSTPEALAWCDGAVEIGAPSMGVGEREDTPQVQDTGERPKRRSKRPPRIRAERRRLYERLTPSTEVDEACAGGAPAEFDPAWVATLRRNLGRSTRWVLRACSRGHDPDASSRFPSTGVLASDSGVEGTPTIVPGAEQLWLEISHAGPSMDLPAAVSEVPLDGLAFVGARTMTALPSLAGVEIERLALSRLPVLRCVAGVEGVEGLRSLTVIGCGELRDPTPFSSLSGLETLRVQGGWWNDHRAVPLRDLEFLRSLAALRDLELFLLEGRFDLGPIAAARSLESVSIQGVVAPDGLPVFPEGSRIQTFASDVPTADLHELVEARDLGELTVVFEPGAHSLELAAGLQKLTSLSLSTRSCGARDEESLATVDLTPLARLPALEQLNLWHIQPEGLPALAGNPAFRSLTLEVAGAQSDRDLLDQIVELHSLRRLFLTWEPSPSDALAAIAQLPALEWLSFEIPADADAQLLSSLERSPALRDLLVGAPWVAESAAAMARVAASRGDVALVKERIEIWLGAVRLAREAAPARAALEAALALGGDEPWAVDARRRLEQAWVERQELEATWGGGGDESIWWRPRR
jgi:hypothetical protein